MSSTVRKLAMELRAFDCGKLKLKPWTKILMMDGSFEFFLFFEWSSKVHVRFPASDDQTPYLTGLITNGRRLDDLLFCCFFDRSKQEWSGRAALL